MKLIVYFISVVAISCTFPTIPDNFSSIVEANIKNKNYSLVMKEFYDYSEQRWRIENHKNGQLQVELCDLKNKKHYTVTKDPKKPFNCTVSTIVTCRMGPTSTKLSKASDFLTGHTAPEMYTTQPDGEARGIKCDVYKTTKKMDMSNFTAGRPKTPGRVYPDYIKYDLIWYFAKANWSIRGENPHVTPVLARLIGAEYAKNDTILKTFDHDYHFIDFLPTLEDADHLGEDLWRPSAAWQCPGTGTDTAVECGAGTRNENGKCVCIQPYKPSSEASSFHLLESHKALVAILPAVGIIAAVKLFV